MKKLEKKLSFNKKTVGILNDETMKNLKGGNELEGFTSIGKVCHSNKYPTDCATAGGRCGGQLE